MREASWEVEDRLKEQGVNIYSSLGYEQTTHLIAERLAQIQKLYSEVIVIASNNDIRVQHSLEFPEGLTTGHNSSMRGEVYWNPSSQYCGIDC